MWSLRGQQMEPIDAAFQAFQSFRSTLVDYDATIFTEQDTRVKVIDKILQEVLGWPLAEIQTEPPAGQGFVDYRLSVNGHARCVVEAKRDGRSLGLEGRTAGRPHKLSGPVFKSEAAVEGIRQSISYCAYKGAELACVTNGREWLIFRGSRIGDGLDVLSGMGFVFPSLEGVAEQFKLFWDLISFDSASAFSYRPHFQEAEGAPVRSIAFSKPVRPPGSQKFLRSDLGADISKVMSQFLGRLSGDNDTDLLAECFVDTPESRKADLQLARISEDLLNQISSLETTDASALQEVIQRTIDSQKNSFVVIVGTKGAGKSTFIDRFFKLVLAEPLTKQCAVAKVDLKASTGDPDTVVAWLQRRVLLAIELAAFEGRSPSFDEIRGMFYFQEYVRLSTGPLKELYDSDKSAFKIEFGQRIDSMRQDDPQAYLAGVLRHIAAGRGKLPVLVFDNADHFTIEFQERVYQYARSLFEDALCLVILPITDRTSWQLSRQGALQSFEHEALFLPTPPTRRVLAKRIACLESRIAQERAQAGQYFTEKGIRLSLDDLAGFTATLQRVFIDTDSIAEWIGNLSNADVRRALQLSSQLIASPHLQVADLVKASWVDRGKKPSVPAWRVKNALVRSSYDIYPSGQNEFVQNVFALAEEVEASPLTGTRLLKLLSDAPDREHEGHFLQVEHILDYMTAMQVSHRASLSWLDSLLKTGLCFSYDPTLTNVYEAQRIEISPSGRQHLSWSVNDRDYIKAMAEVTPLRDRSVFEVLRDLDRRPEREVWEKRTKVFAGYLLDEDSRYCQVPGHEAYKGQLELSDLLSRMAGEPIRQVGPRQA